MKNYRVKVREDKAEFFEELMRYLDFLDYEKVEGFSEPRIYPSFEIRSSDRRGRVTAKSAAHTKDRQPPELDDNLSSIREVMQKIDAMRDKSKRK